jgi:hypothetical protein
MQLDVVVLRRRTTEEIDAWKYRADERKRIITQRKDGSCLPPEEAWQQLAITINQLACAYSRHNNHSHLQVDIFLIVRGLLIENLSVISNLEDVVNAARDHTWGANIYVVWDQTPDKDFKVLYGKSRAKLEQFFRAVVRSRVTDLIEVTKDAKKTEPDEYNRLSEGALQSEKRREKLRKLVNDDGWEVLHHDRSYLIKDFLEMFFEEEPLSASAKNLAVFYEHELRRNGGWALLFNKSDKFYGGGKLFVTTIVQKDASDLEVIWKQKYPAAEVLYLNGMLEWLYSYIRLRQAHHHPIPSASPTVRAEDQVESVEPSEIMLSRREPDQSDLRLLVTSTFYYRERRTIEDDDDRADLEREFCIHAANEIGDVLRTLPFNVAVEIHHCVTCEQLPDILKGKSFTAWLHLGHGDREGGLKEESAEPGRAGQYASPERWRDCFNLYEERLPLVVFSACESSGLARMFAESVSSVAIGFENEVLTKATRTFSAEVIPKVLREGGGLPAALDAFRSAYAWLSSKSDQDMPYSAARPKLFRVKFETS